MISVHPCRKHRKLSELGLFSVNTQLWEHYERRFRTQKEMNNLGRVFTFVQNVATSSILWSWT
jgi:hypothetical protein